MEDPQYYNLRNYALDFLYNRFAHDDDVASSLIKNYLHDFGCIFEAPFFYIY